MKYIEQWRNNSKGEKNANKNTAFQGSISPSFQPLQFSETVVYVWNNSPFECFINKRESNILTHLPVSASLCNHNNGKATKKCYTTLQLSSALHASLIWGESINESLGFNLLISKSIRTTCLIVGLDTGELSVQKSATFNMSSISATRTVSLSSIRLSRISVMGVDCLTSFTQVTRSPPSSIAWIGRLPVSNSNRTTPKLYISHFSVTFIVYAYSAKAHKQSLSEVSICHIKTVMSAVENLIPCCKQLPKTWMNGWETWLLVHLPTNKPDKSTAALG